LYFGVENSMTRARNLQRLLVALGDLTVWPYTDHAAEVYGRLAAELKRIGRPMQQIDIQIAAIALASATAPSSAPIRTSPPSQGSRSKTGPRPDRTGD
jgi:predicted nucleic acid-binding protein